MSEFIDWLSFTAIVEAVALAVWFGFFGLLALLQGPLEDDEPDGSEVETFDAEMGETRQSEPFYLTEEGL